MKFYKDPLGKVFAYESDGSQDHIIPADQTAITESEATALLAPPTVPLAGVKVALSASVDDSISAIYSRFQRFKAEYDDREAAARAFKAVNYTGTPDPWVMSFATPAGKTATQATDLIIAQADALKAALSVLGALRMRKYEIAAATSAATAQAIHDDILTKAQTAAAGL